jgi:hypothetical protein
MQRSAASSNEEVNDGIVEGHPVVLCCVVVMMIERKAPKFQIYGHH